MNQTRKVNVFSTKGTNRTGANALIIPTDVTTLGQLFPYLNKAGVEFNGMKIMVAQGKQTLEHEDAILPAGDFTLSLTPVKTKAGATYAEMKAYVKAKRVEAVEADDEDTLDEIGNYTQLCRDDMEALYDFLKANEDVSELSEIDLLKARISALEAQLGCTVNVVKEEIPQDIKDLQNWALNQNQFKSKSEDDYDSNDYDDEEEY